MVPMDQDLTVFIPPHPLDAAGAAVNDDYNDATQDTSPIDEGITYILNLS